MCASPPADSPFGLLSYPLSHIRCDDNTFALRYILDQQAMRKNQKQQKQKQKDSSKASAMVLA